MTDREIDIRKLFLFIKDNKRVFLTGAGGTGKSYLVRKLINYVKNPVVLGTTGIAANNIGGETVHKFFRLGISDSKQKLEAYTNTQVSNIMKQYDCDSVKAEYIMFSKMKKALDIADLIIIDEVSMMSNVLYDLVLSRLEKVMKLDIPILFVGDLYQLPPVNKNVKDNNIKHNFIFEHKDWENIKVINLQDIKRTTDIEWAYIQKDIRVGKYNPDIDNFVKSHNKLKNLSYEENTYLMSTNKEVDNHNNLMLERMKESKRYLSRPKIIYKEKWIKPSEISDFMKDNNIQEELVFKIGARVMFIVNDYEVGYYNGELGVIEGLTPENCIIIKSLVKEATYTINRTVFTKYKIDGNGTKIQMIPTLEVAAMPFRLGYSITIHKSQGMTMTEAVLDCKRIFEPQQFYVGASRVSIPDNLVILNFNRTMIQENRVVADFYKNADTINLEDLYYREGENNLRFDEILI